MKNIKVLSTAILSIMMSCNIATANIDLNNATEEEIAKAIANVLKQNPKIAYDSLKAYNENAALYQKEKTMIPLEEKLAEVLKDNPGLVVGALHIYEQELRQKELMETADLYKEYVAEINSGDLFIGNPNPKYTLVEFFDFSCGYCKKMAPKLKKLAEKNKDLKIVLKPLSFLSENSTYAAKATIAASKQGKLQEMYMKIMEQSHITKDSFDKIAKEIGLDISKYQKDYSSIETQNLLNENKLLAEKIKIKSVPTLVLEGMPLYAVEEVQLQRAIDILREQN